MLELPVLASGVLVHFRDIFLPYEDPKEWVVQLRRASACGVSPAGFLAFRDEVEVVSRRTHCLGTTSNS